ncbi:MAG: M20 family metallopeptidase [Acidobacteriota bacterium]|nr:MAG: M20 family metallopeptidase [Acidobacteriota bacterium]
MTDQKQTKQFVDGLWEETIVPTITDYIRIPNVSSMFDPNWQENGHVERAVELVQGWLDEHKPEGTTFHIGRLKDRTPLLLLDVPGKSDDTILMYGHLDKQPEMTGWRDGLGAWEPVRDGDKLYGRGGADDGYAVFASICSLLALRKQGIGHARIVILIEFSEESGSPDLPAYVEHFVKEIGTPSLIVCLDSGAGNYEQLWSTTSLRGLVGATLRVDVLDEGVHSGDASGIVASSFRILRELISRLEDQTSGKILPDALSVDIPEQRRAQAAEVADVLSDEVVSKFPWCGDMRAIGDDPTELILNRTWRPALAVTGQEGMPALKDAGNVLRPYTTLSLSLRIPPTLDPNRARSVLEELLTKDPPYGAKVTLDFHEPAPGWNAPQLASWLGEALDEASIAFYGKPALHMGEGGSIPFMGMLGEKFPQAQFVITGVLGPQSNAHGPNEFLHIDYAKKLTACVAHVIEKHFRR